MVGPYADAILSGANAAALADWLNANAYAFLEQGEDMVAEYSEKERYFVATKINAIYEDSSYALAEGAIEPLVLSFASAETVYYLRITLRSAVSPEVLLYGVTDHVMVPEQYPLHVGYGNWQENAFAPEFGEGLPVTDLPDYYEISPQALSSYLSTGEFCLTKLTGTVSADRMVDIRLLIYEGAMV